MCRGLRTEACSRSGRLVRLGESKGRGQEVVGDKAGTRGGFWAQAWCSVKWGLPAKPCSSLFLGLGSGSTALLAICVPHLLRRRNVSPGEPGNRVAGLLAQLRPGPLQSELHNPAARGVLSDHASAQNPPWVPALAPTTSCPPPLLSPSLTSLLLLEHASVLRPSHMLFRLPGMLFP